MASTLRGAGGSSQADEHARGAAEMDHAPRSSDEIAVDRSRYPFSIIRERIRAHGADVIDFAFGAQPPSPPADVAEMIREHPELAGRSAGVADIEHLSERAAAMLAREYGAAVQPGDIVPVPGGRAGIVALAAVTLEAGDQSLFMEPSYPSFARLADHRRIGLVRCWQDPERSFALDLDPVRRAEGRVSFAAISYPSNPTGALISGEVLDDLRDALPADTVVFNDATYAPLSYAERPRSLLERELHDRLGRRVVELHSLSKLFALNGLPISFLAGDSAIMHAVRRYGEFALTPPNAMLVRIAVRCVDDGAWLDAMRHEYRDRVERLRAVLGQAGFRPLPTAGGLYVICPTPATLGGRRISSSWAAAHELLDRHGVAVMPWDAQGAGLLRFSAMYSRAHLDALERIGRTLDLAG